ncbi:MAG: hypothetical protein ACRDJ2_17175, partial [Actinomycetota bacterium]
AFGDEIATMDPHGGCKREPGYGTEFVRQMLEDASEPDGIVLVAEENGRIETRQERDRLAVIEFRNGVVLVACFRNVAAHLGPGGRFVIEVVVPALQRLPPGDIFHVFRAEKDYWGIDEYDVAVQGLISHHLEIVGDRVERISIPFRYAWPSEYDLMAQLAGMTLRERWGGWKREPFTNESRKHVSVWEKPTPSTLG